MAIILRRFILPVIIMGLLCLPLLNAQAQDKRLNESAQKYQGMIAKLELSDPSSEGLSQQEYDNLLADLYFEVGFSYYESRCLSEAVDNFSTSLSYYVKIDDKDSQIFVYRVLGTLAMHLHEYDAAAEYFYSSLEMAEKADDKNSIVKSLLDCHELAIVRNDADEIYRILAYLNSFSSDILDKSTRLSMLQSSIDYALNTGDHDMALLYLESYRKELDAMSEDDRALEMGTYDIFRVKYLSAVARYQEAAEIIENNSKDIGDKVQLVRDYAEILYYYALAGNMQKVAQYDKEISAFESEDGIAHGIWMEVYAFMRTAFVKLGNYEKVLELISKTEALGVMEERVSLLKGSALHRLGRNEEALEYFHKFLEDTRIMYGRDTRKYAVALRHLANMEAFCGDMESGSQHYIESMDVLRSIIKRELPYISYDRLEEYWNNISTGIVEMAAYAVEAGLRQGELSVSAYEALVMFKGFLFSSEKAFSEYVRHSSDESLKNLYAEIQAMRDTMEGLRKSYSQNEENIIRLKSDLTLKEAELANLTGEFSVFGSFLDISYESLRKVLKDNEVVVDFVDHISERYGRKYVAFVYRKDWQAPLLVPVCTQVDLDSFNMPETRPDAIYGRKYSSQFVDLLWKPLEQYVHEGDVVYMIPSGDLHLISFDSFQLRDRSLLGSRYDFVRLSSARELMERAESGSVSDAVLYGGLQYDMTGDDRMAEAGKHAVRMSRAVSRSVRGNGERFVDLPMSGKEVASVSELLDGSGVSVKCYVGKEGTEESFMSLSAPSPDILHFATHGFYYTPEDAAQVSGLSGYKSAMRLSGLVMAGGNAEWMGEEIPRNTLGGILTADDIAKCDLSGTGLVVLTACDTGKGKVTSEGVYGLQRAFKKAGAETILMSLWKVDDKAASEFISIFYESLTSNGWNKRAALKSAKDKMRHKYPSPYYWAGFIMLD